MGRDFHRDGFTGYSVPLRVVHRYGDRRMDGTAGPVVDRCMNRKGGGLPGDLLRGHVHPIDAVRLRVKGGPSDAAEKDLLMKPIVKIEVRRDGDSLLGRSVVADDQKFVVSLAKVRADVHKIGRIAAGIYRTQMAIDIEFAGLPGRMESEYKVDGCLFPADKEGFSVIGFAAVHGAAHPIGRIAGVWGTDGLPVGTVL